MEKTKGFALITGASKGIGKEIARQLAAQGWSLLLVARSAHLLEAMKSEFEGQYKVKVHVYAVDLAASDAPGKA